LQTMTWVAFCALTIALSIKIWVCRVHIDQIFTMLWMFTLRNASTQLLMATIVSLERWSLIS
jgi:ABC-type multidrug transport system permease subunit